MDVTVYAVAVAAVAVVLWTLEFDMCSTLQQLRQDRYFLAVVFKYILHFMKSEKRSCKQ
jgi:hypothetical protein